MLVRLNTSGQPYVNIIMLAYLLAVVEFHIAMEQIRLYNHAENTWNIRRIFWYLVLGTPSAISIAAVTLAAIKYIAQ